MEYDIIPFPRSRKLEVDALELASKRHIIHGFLEVDVTVPRRILKGTSGTDGHPLSFTAYVIACYARAINAHPTVQAYRDLRNRLIVFHDVDVSTLIEHRTSNIPVAHIIRNANTLSVREISEEIRAVQADPHPWGLLEGSIALVSRLPRFVRILFLRGLRLNPNWIKQTDGTTEVSSFGMFGKRVRWGIGLLYVHTVGLWVGGVAERPMAHEGSIALRESLNVTLSFDHDLVDGAPAARFASTFTELLESGALLDEEAPTPLFQAVKPPAHMQVKVDMTVNSR